MFSWLPSVLIFLQKMSLRGRVDLGLVALGLTLSAIGLIMFGLTGEGTVNLPDTLSPAQAELGQLTLEVNGAVKNPGIYQLPTNARIAEALSAAGGLSLEADLQLVSQKINLAEKISDGQKIMVPYKTVATAGGVALMPKTDSSLISVNEASLAQLDELHGIGEKKANDIINGRPFTDLETVKEVASLSDEVWNKIKNQLSL